MKIYPNKSNVSITKEVNLITDVPLSFIDTNSSDYLYKSTSTELLKTELKKEVLPYDRLDSKEFICLFNSDGSQIDYEKVSMNFVREGNTYVYMPYGSRIFSPRTFEYSVIAKKIMIYKSNMPYNIKALSINNNGLSHKLMPIFGDAPKRLIAPSNILVNNGDLSIDGLSSVSIKDADIAFISLKNHETAIEEDMYMEGETYESPFDKSVYINEFNANIMGLYTDDSLILEGDDKLGDDSLIHFVKLKESKEFVMRNLDIYSNAKISTDRVFTVPQGTANIKYLNPFGDSKHTPILIEEHVGKGFMIYASETIISDVKSNSKIIYETIIKVFLKGYLATGLLEEWIADKMPDFVAVNKKLTKKDKFVSSLELHKIFGLGVDDVTPFTINIDKERFPFVEFTGMHQNYLTFKKNIAGDNKIYADPIKPDGAISIYTQRNNIIYYDKFIYMINNNVEEKFRLERKEDVITINLQPYKNSTLAVYIPEIKEPLSIPLVTIEGNQEIHLKEETFYLTAKSNNSASFFEVINIKNYTPDKGNILSTISINQKGTKKIIYDMRQRGGGLKADSKDNHDCFDIGHVHGRQYRKAGSIIITLPAYLKEHKKLVLNIVEQYTLAGDCPIILFEEDHNV